MISQATNELYISWKYQKPLAFRSFWFEHLDYDAWKQYAAQNWTYSFFAAGIYLLIIFTVRYLMRQRSPLNLRYALVIWNVCLGAFSALGFFRIGQELISVLMMPNGFHNSICLRVGLNPPAAFYSVAFALSKYVELGDTLFIVLRKQPLIFLQWYHHCSSLILAWQVMPYSEPIFRWLGLMNYGVHALMYPYFALKVMKYRIPRKVSMLITSFQLLQMIIGVAMNIYSVYVINVYGPQACERHSTSVQWISSVYSSFLILFAYFFYERYVRFKSTKIS